MKKIWLLLFAIALSSLDLYCQQVRSVIPYELVAGKMVIDVFMNGEPKKMIFDTGGEKSAIIENICSGMNLAVRDSMRITDVNSNVSYYKLVEIEDLLSPDKAINFKGNRYMVLNDATLENFGVVGIFGSDMLSMFQVVIDSRSKTITLTTAEKESPASLRYMHPFMKAGMPIIAVNVGYTGIAALFDTGFDGFIELRESDRQKLDSLQVAITLSEGVGGGSIGASGVTQYSTMSRVAFDRISLGPVKFDNASAITSNPPYTLLGMKLLQHGLVTIDYPRARFYFEPFDDKRQIDMLTQYDNIDVTVLDGTMRIATVWSSAAGQVEAGDRVLCVNDQPVPENIDFWKVMIDGFPLLKEQPRKLTVETKNGIREVFIVKE